MTSDFNMDGVEQIKELMGDKFDGLVETYLRTNRVHVDNLRKGYDAGDAQAIVDTAHPMKSSAGNMGLSGLSKSSETLESQAKNVVAGQEDLSSLEVLISKVEAQFVAGEAFLKTL